MIVTYEPQCRGLEHAEINAAFLIFLTKAKEGIPILFYGNEDHISSVKRNIQALGFPEYIPAISWINTPTTDPTENIVKRFCIELYNFYRVYRNSQKQSKIFTLILLSATSTTLIGVKLVEKMINAKIFIVLHGILESIKEKPKGIIKQLAWFRNFLSLRANSKICYIATAEFIKNNVIREIPLLKDKILNVEFPYIYPKTTENNKQLEITNNGKIKSKIVITCAGVGSFKKGTNNFFILAQTLNEKYSHLVNFVYAGRIADNELKEQIPLCVEIHTDNNMLQPYEYQQLILQTDYLIFFYPANTYKFGVSGVFLDALKYEIPIIAIENDFFNYCQKKIGHIGWLCSDMEALKKTVIELIEAPPTQELIDIKNNYRIFKETITPTQQAKKLAKILNHDA